MVLSVAEGRGSARFRPLPKQASLAANAIKLRLETHPEFGGFNRLEERAKRFFKFPDIRVAEVIELFAKQVASVAALSAWS
jgi:hypothetical protein